MQQVDFTLIGIIHQMGLSARIVGILLVFMSMWSMYVFIDRLLAFWFENRNSTRALSQAWENFFHGRLEDAVEATSKSPGAYRAQIMAAALRSYLQDAEQATRFDVDLAERAIEKARGIVIARMKTGMTSLATISATAPFVGLFGTVLGVINSFVGMAKTGSGGLGAVAAGIAEALIETATGLAVAIPAVWIYNYFNGRIDELQIEIDSDKADIMDHLMRLGAKNAGTKAKSGT